MATGKEETIDKSGAGGGEGGETKTPPVTTKEAPKDPPEVKTKADTKGSDKGDGEPKDTKGADKGGGGSPKRVQITGDDEIPDDAELLELSKTALNARLRRATAAALRERFGTDDAAEIKKKLDRLQQLEADEDKRKREAMSAQDRLEADLRAANAEKDEAYRQLRIERNERIVVKENSRITNISTKYIDSDDDTIEVVHKRFARYLAEEYGDQIKDPKFNVTDKEIDKWFKKYAEEHPKHAKVIQKTEPEKKPLTNGANDNTPSPNGQSGQSQAKNFSPSATNPMSRQQAKDEAAKQGFRW